MTMNEFIKSYRNTYRYSLCGSYDFRLREARSFIAAAEEATSCVRASYIRECGAAMYGVKVADV